MHTTFEWNFRINLLWNVPRICHEINKKWKWNGCKSYRIEKQIEQPFNCSLARNYLVRCCGSKRFIFISIKSKKCCCFFMWVYIAESRHVHVVNLTNLLSVVYIQCNRINVHKSGTRLRGESKNVLLIKEADRAFLQSPPQHIICSGFFILFSFQITAHIWICNYLNVVFYTCEIVLCITRKLYKSTLNDPMIFAFTQRRKWAMFYSTFKYGCYFSFRVNFMNENTLSEPKVSESLCILFWVLFLLLNIIVFMYTWYA